MWLTLALVLGFAVWFWSLRSGFDSQTGFWGFMLMIAVAAAMLIWFMARNRITVTDTEIRVSLGPTNTAVEIASVVSMKKVNNPVASSGTSVRRIEIVYRKDGRQGVMYISPADRDGFINAVRGKNPEIRVY